MDINQNVQGFRLEKQENLGLVAYKKKKESVCNCITIKLHITD